MSEEFKDISVDDIEFIPTPTSEPTQVNKPVETATGTPTQNPSSEESDPPSTTKGEGKKDTTTTPPTTSNEPIEEPEEEGKQEIDFDSLLKEKSKGKYNTYEELLGDVEQLTKNQRTQQDKIENELIQKFSDFRKGRNIDNKEVARLFLETQVMDISSLKPLEAIKAKMKMDNPKRSDTDIDFLIHNKYKLDENEFEADEVRLAQLQLEDDALAAKKELQAAQQKAALIEENASTPLVNSKEQQESIDQANKKWEKDVQKSIQDFQQLAIELGEDHDPFSFTVENQTEIKDTLSNLPVFWNRYVTEDKNGNITEHVDQLRNDLALIFNQKTILNSVFKHGISKGKELMLEQRKQPSTLDQEQQKGHGQTQTGTANSELDEIAEGFAAQLNNH